MHSSPPAPQSERPQRIRIMPEQGSALSLPTGASTYSLLGSHNTRLLTGKNTAVHCFIWGISPEHTDISHALLTALQQYSLTPAQSRAVIDTCSITVLETEQYSKQMPEQWHNTLPDAWNTSTPDAVLKQAQSLLAEPAVQVHILYIYAPRLFPSFWGKPLGILKSMFAHHKASQTPRAKSHTTSSKHIPVVLIPGTETSLLVKEISRAFTERNFQTTVIAPQDIPQYKLQNPAPTLFFSINGAGLDAFGETFHFYQALHTPVALWCVDNPWHILCTFKAPWWQELILFVTDASFIPGLQQHGAQHVYHLPLAAGQHFFSAQKNTTLQLNPLVFMGRAAFPQKESFFAGLHLETDAPQLYKTALDKLARSTEYADFPHYHWWTKELNLHSLWPDKHMRLAGLGAEECALKNRSSILTHCAKQAGRITLAGDQLWHKHVPNAGTILPAMDYYATVPGLYATAQCCIDIPSLLLPAGATQRHFDVWAAKGMCLSQRNFGTSLFAEELTRHTSFSTASDLLDKWENLQTNTWIQQNWFEHIITKHCYSHRIEYILKQTNLA